ncbi:hypothetical protein CYK57_01814 [Actinobacillus pleuropneumoniae]|uniref:Bifunctional riboflavin kinase/FMN adenylyltransferase n=1 Tax=Actinobacillus pleuropneumoniae serotype 5b (strain L20) TaxID=416269 RepID=A3N2M3_ACTP2|nr:DUF5358 domain-containing protein [Actinobacillus pleuropneumoniae]ABN74659.1 hypothetical protein APL_1575 [Actinobacillus pleuropneumoniae serovar 5b str. L20]MEE3683909.1 DUF5358 domain-containing protein [Actinobacillus pleuropneumoniae]QSZ39636.1 hypothetical protein CYK57_01814 [Actinobacillus pleuropneumoniae]UKH09917.1 DUF5358 domain-containing protein [Actinobacillus pleuropneumoniae]UPK78059.1 DUF5358 domain-containing protein [Actinobacillus pleuropneumoniae]
MFKKITLFSFIALIAGCSSSSQLETFPGEFANADYVLSDKDAQRWVVASRQVEQCIYPNLTRIQQQAFSKEDSYIHSQYVFFYPLEEIIGEQYVKIIQDDEKSMGYAQYLFKKFRDNQEFEPLADKQCLVLREKAKNDLAVVKGQYKSGMVEETKSEAKNADGVATNQNKFFFDIIKWGSMLLL